MEQIVERHVSPDGLLHFVVVKDDDEHLTFGFEGFAWHTHASMQSALYKLPEEDSAERFISDLLSNKIVIAVRRRGGKIVDVSIDDDPEIKVPSGDDESIEHRYWNGSHYASNTSGF